MLIRGFVALLLLFAVNARGDDVADVVRCKMPDGSLYFGAAPPEKCVPVGRSQPLPPVEKKRRFRPTIAPTPGVEPQEEQ